ncbi:MAG: putative Holliday junction resolvase [Myxococcota bacterium]|jgi:putative Holliday junction resolvase
MGLDVGTKTIGIALSDPLGMFAQPDRTLSRKGVAKDVAVICLRIQEQDVQAVVVGLPFELDGTESRSARLARQIGEAVRVSAQVPVIYVDERYSSVQAERSLIFQGASRDRRKKVIDQAAAAIILQSWLDHGDDVAED